MADGERRHFKQLGKALLGDGKFLAEFRDGFRGETDLAAFAFLSGGDRFLLRIGGSGGSGSGLLLFKLVDAFQKGIDRLLLFVDFFVEGFEFLAGQTTDFFLEGLLEIGHFVFLSKRG